MAKKDKENKKEEGKGGAGKKIILLVIIAIVVSGIVGAGAFFFLSSRTPVEVEAPTAPKEVQELSEGAPTTKSTVGPMFDLQPFIVNLLDENGTRYLKIELTLELSSPDVESELKARLPQVRDTIILLIGSRTYTEIADVQGKLQLRADVVKKVNDLLHTGRVERLYFTDFVIQ